MIDGILGYIAKYTAGASKFSSLFCTPLVLRSCLARGGREESKFMLKSVVKVISTCNLGPSNPKSCSEYLWMVHFISALRDLSIEIPYSTVLGVREKLGVVLDEKNG